jgi:hypothetical protein
MMVFVRWLIICVLLLSANSAVAQQDISRVIWDRLSSDYTKCYAYYEILLQCRKSDLDDVSRRDFLSASHAAYKESTRAGVAAGTTSNEISVRAGLYKEQMMSAMDIDCANFSRVLHVYEPFCKTLMTDRKSHIEYLKRTTK